MINLDGGNTLISYVKNSCDDVQIIDASDDSQIVLIGECDLEELLNVLSVQKVDQFEINDRIIIEGYSNKLNNYVVSNFKKVNIQISIFNDGVVVGYPLIKNSF
jgi:hypothetical protein